LLEARDGREEQLAADALSARDRAIKTAADHQVAVQAFSEQVRRLSQLAAAGRAARDIASELQALVWNTDVITARVLGECPVDHPTRGDVELLRADAIRAAALAGELLLASADIDEPDPVPHGGGGERRRL
jgi:hypothetical protein